MNIIFLFFSNNERASHKKYKRITREMRARTFISHRDRPLGTKKDVNNLYCKNLLMKLFKTTHTLFISSTISHPAATVYFQLHTVVEMIFVQFQ